MLFDRTALSRRGLSADQPWRRHLGTAGPTLAASLLLSCSLLAGAVQAQDSKLPPILILPGQQPQTVTEEPAATPAPQPAAAQPAAQPAEGSGDEPAVVISPAPGTTQPAAAPAASAPAASAPAEAAAPQDDEPAVVISPAPGTQPAPAQPQQATAPAEQPAGDDEPAVVISPAPGAQPAAPQLQPQQEQQAQGVDDEPEQEDLPDEAPVNSEAEPSTQSPAADKAADQGEAMEPVGDTTQVIYAADGVDVPVDSAETLEELAQQLQQDGKARVQIYGYATSPDGSENAARRLSLERAQAVRSFLVERGVPVTHFTIRPQGIATDGGPPDRVDIVLLHP